MTKAQFKIQRGIPIPPVGRPRTMSSAFYATLAKLQKGDSFFVPAATHTEKRRIVQRTTTQRRKFDDRNFAARREENGVRIWRTE